MKKIAIMIFTNSPGWSEKPKSLIQRFAPYVSAPKNAGAISSTSATAMVM